MSWSNRLRVGSICLALMGCAPSVQRVTNVQRVTTVQRVPPPSTVRSVPAPVEQIVAGADHTCARMRDGTVRCWGTSREGVLGQRDRAWHSAPVVVEGVTGATQLAASPTATCAIVAGGKVQCWGRFVSQHDDPLDALKSTAEKPVFAIAGVEHATALAISSIHGCALLEDQTVRCWGSNAQGRLGDGTTRPSVEGRKVEGVDHVTALSVNETHTCARKQDGSWWCWGLETSSESGEQTYKLAENPDARNWAETTGSEYRFCHRNTDHVWRCDTSADEELKNVELLGVSRSQVCTVRRDHTIRCSTEAPGEGVDAVATEPDVRSIAVGNRHACLLRNDGSVACWGSMDVGQTGTREFSLRATHARAVDVDMMSTAAEPAAVVPNCLPAKGVDASPSSVELRPLDGRSVAVCIQPEFYSESPGIADTHCFVANADTGTVEPAVHWSLNATQARATTEPPANPMTVELVTGGARLCDRAQHCSLARWQTPANYNPPSLTLSDDHTMLLVVWRPTRNDGEIHPANNTLQIATYRTSNGARMGAFRHDVQESDAGNVSWSGRLVEVNDCVVEGPGCSTRLLLPTNGRVARSIEGNTTYGGRAGIENNIALYVSDGATTLEWVNVTTGARPNVLKLEAESGYEGVQSYRNGLLVAVPLTDESNVVTAHFVDGNTHSLIRKVSIPVCAETSSPP